MNTKPHNYKREIEAKQRQVSQDLAIAYHMAKGLAELLTRVKRDVEFLPEREREDAKLAAHFADSSYIILNGLIIDRGNESGRDNEG